MESVAHLVLSGTCLGYLPTHYAARWVEQGLLRQLGGAALSYRAVLSLVSRPVEPDEALNAAGGFGARWRKNPHLRGMMTFS